MRVDDLKLQKNETELNLMRGIKRVFDPKGILNPGTVING
ncbi:FAD-linked oxidase C-terminal domain-containing protein [Hornefia butyriciproducens]|nr:FAD-linked oxidase C-terminal domain-containing protein [Hornefia butyriciproducens]MDY5424320.1 FAD-linked oxidase C-terminal domain-containing protein [Hornefia butyriciproducens]